MIRRFEDGTLVAGQAYDEPIGSAVSNRTGESVADWARGVAQRDNDMRIKAYDTLIFGAEERIATKLATLEYDRVMRAIVALHRLALDGPVEYCVQDGKPWPCRTVVATSAIEYAQTHPELDYRPKGGAA